MRNDLKFIKKKDKNILEEDKVDLMYRKKKVNGKILKYYTYPGGGLEENETLENCVKREVKEEFDIDVEVLQLLKTVEYKENITHYFACKKIKGALTLSGEEKQRSNKENYYEVRKVPLTEIDSIDLYEKELIEETKKIINKE